MRKFKQENPPPMARKGSVGVTVMNSKSFSTRENKLLIAQDLQNHKHVPIHRKRASSDEREKGFLVVGVSAITFLAADNASVIASHPLAFIEMYSRSLHGAPEMTYTVQKKHFLKKDEIMSFTFVADSAEALEGLIREVDRHILAHIAKDGQGRPQTYVLDHTRQHEVHSDATVNILPGERFVCERQIIDANGPGLLGSGGKRQTMLAIVNPRGICFLAGNGEAADGRGLLDCFSYKAFKSFGASDDDTFGFQVSGESVGKPEEDAVYVCLNTEGCANLINMLVSRRAKDWSDLRKSGADSKGPPSWPREYTTKDY